MDRPPVTGPHVVADIPGTGIVTNITDAFGGWAWDKVAGGITKWVLGALADLCSGALGFMATAARPDVTAVWFSGPGSPYATVRNLAAVATLGFAFIAIISGTLKGDGPGTARRVAVAIPAAALGTAIAVPVTAALIDIVDAASLAVLNPAASPGAQFLTGFGATAAGMTGGFAAVAVGLVAVVAALALWAELLVRSALIYLVVSLMPLTFATLVWPAARGIFRRTVEVLVALIVSKFAISVALAVGVAALGGAGTATGEYDTSTATSLGVLLSGTAILLVSAFSPFLVLKLIPAVEGAVLAAGVSQVPITVTQTAASAAITAASVSRLAKAPTSPTDGGGGGPAPKPASTPRAATAPTAPTPTSRGRPARTGDEA